MSCCQQYWGQWYFQHMSSQGRHRVSAMLTGDFEYLGRAPRSAVASPGSPPHCCYCSPLHCLGRGSPGQPSVAVGPGTGGVSRPESPSGRRGQGQSGLCPYSPLSRVIQGRYRFSLVYGFPVTGVPVPGVQVSIVPVPDIPVPDFPVPDMHVPDIPVPWVPALHF